MFDVTGERFRNFLDFDTDDASFQRWNILPPPAPERYAALKDSIAAGTWTGRVVIDEIGTILDGHQAYCAFRALCTPPRHIMQVKVGDRTPAEIESLIRLWNYGLGRQPSQEERREAIRRQLKLTPAWSNRAVARLLGVDDKTVAGVREGLEKSAEIPQLRCEGGRGITKGLPLLISRDRQEARKNAPLLQDAKNLHAKPYSRRLLLRKKWEQRREEMARLGADAAAPDNIHLFHCDFRHLDDRLLGLGLGPGSVDLVWTDPPWAEAALAHYEALGVFTKRWLRPGGLLGVYTGNIYKDAANDVLRQHLSKLWELVVLHKEAGSNRMVGSFQSTYQPILLFGNGEPTQKFTLPDSYPSRREEKEYHDWQRTMNETLHWLSLLTTPGQLVIDPFGGGFTTAAASLKIGLRCVSCDIEEENVQIGKYRLAQAAK